MFVSVRTYLFLFTCALSVAAPLSELARAMSVTPIVIDMVTTGRHSKASIRVVNDGAKKLPVEIVISRVELGPKGEKKSWPAGDDFLIFPPQALVAPGATQTFRVQWVGEPLIKKSRTYIFSVNQVPVKMPKGVTGVQLVFNFAAVVNIAPPKGTASIALLKTGIGRDKKGKRKPALTVSNSGNIHAKLSDATIRLSGSGGWSKTLTPAFLRQSLGVGLVQPGKTRRLLLPVELPASVSNLRAEVDYRYKPNR